jgi:hypothetical protein
MDINIIVTLVTAQVGEENAKKVLEFLKGLIDKMDDKVIMITKVKGKGACLLISNKSDMLEGIFKKKPTMYEIETMINKVEL